MAVDVGNGPHRLYGPGDSAVHRQPADRKLLVTIGFVLIVVLTPREAVWAFAGYAVLIAGAVAAARLPLRLVARRMSIELPFVAFALLLPFASQGPQVSVLGLQLSASGLWAAWNVLVKATLGLAASIVLAATTDLPSLLAALQRLRFPPLMLQIMTFMLRYADVLADEWRRMRIARESRGFAARDLRATPVLASSAGALFIRSYERGERVHLAMLSRGGGTPADKAAKAAEPPATSERANPAAQAGAIEVAGLSFAYPDGRQVLHGVDLRVSPGERVALLGPNGAGKTTLVLHLNGILTGGLGSVRVGGLPVAKENLREIRRRVGVVFQDPDDQLFLSTVRDDVAFGPANLGLRGTELDDRVAWALAQVGLADLAERPPHHLSFGQRRRAALATALAMQPHVLVLDEPTSNLDPASRRELSEVLRRLSVTILIVTHDLPYALELCPRSVIIDAGRVAADGATADLLKDSELLASHRLELPAGFSV